MTKMYCGKQVSEGAIWKAIYQDENDNLTEPQYFIASDPAGAFDIALTIYERRDDVVAVVSVEYVAHLEYVEEHLIKRWLS